VRFCGDFYHHSHREVTRVFGAVLATFICTKTSALAAHCQSKLVTKCSSARQCIVWSYSVAPYIPPCSFNLAQDRSLAHPLNIILCTAVWSRVTVHTVHHVVWNCCVSAKYSAAQWLLFVPPDLTLELTQGTHVSL